MPAFKDEHIIIIAPGSQTTLAQLGLPESFTPARFRIKSRMFPAPTPGEFEPTKIRVKTSPTKQPADPRPAANGVDSPAVQATTEVNTTPAISSQQGEATEELEEDFLTDEGAIWPMQSGRIVDWPCFFALMQHTHKLLNAPFHTPIMLIGQPCWSPKEHEKLAQFFFEKFRCPALALMDSAIATCYAFAQPTATVIDIGKDKADITAVYDFLADNLGRSAAVPTCGGDAMTNRLMTLLKPKGFTFDMCEKLKKSAICEVLPPGTPLPSPERASGSGSSKASATNPAAAASTGAISGGASTTNGGSGSVPAAGGDVEMGDGPREEDDNEGVIDVASIVTGGKMNEYLAKKDKEKADKAAAKKKGTDQANAQLKAQRLKNSERYTNSFWYDDGKQQKKPNGVGDLSGKPQPAPAAATMADSQKASLATSDPANAVSVPPSATTDPAQVAPGVPTAAAAAATSDGAVAAPPVPMPQAELTSPTAISNPRNAFLANRKEVSVGVERFQAHTGPFLTHLTGAIQRTIAAYPDAQKRSQLWENLLIVGNGSKVRGFKEALLATLQSRYVVSPSTATMFTSELPSTFSTPLATGANTPQPGMSMQQPARGNPLLYAATTASGQQLLPAQQLPQTPLPPGQMPLPGQATPLHYQPSSSVNHASQGPSGVKMGKLPDYFPEWKDHGLEEAVFLGAQIAAKVIFNDPQGGTSKGFMSRSDYNESGPEGIHTFTF